MITSTYTWVYVAAIAMAVVSTIAVVAATRRQRRRSPQCANPMESTTDSAPKVQIPTIAKHQESSCAIDAESLKPFVKSFAGEMGALWQIAHGSLEREMAESVFTNLNDVVENNGDTTLQNQWKIFIGDRNAWDESIYSSKAAQLLSLFKTCGVRMSLEKTIRWNSESARHYQLLGAKVADGTLCRVMIPCAIYQNEIFEKGIVQPKQ